MREASSGPSQCGTPLGTPDATPHHQRVVPLRNAQRNESTLINKECRRTENMLKIWILEVKGVQNKKRYYCNVLVDGQLQHSTVAKQKTNMCFWGEDFQIDLESQDSTVCVELMRQTDKKNTKMLGRVEIQLDSETSAELVEKWYLVKLDKSEREIPSLRIKYRFRSLTILPLGGYWGLREYLVSQSLSLCQLLEPKVTVKVKEDVAAALVNISHAEGRATEFLVSLILNDILKIAENEQCLFRGNSVATKAIEVYMRLVGEKYLQETLASVVESIISNTDDLEVDPMRIQNLASLPTVIKQHQAALRLCVEDVWERILKSADAFPIELRKVFHKLRQRLLLYPGKGELTDNLISACVFLRFLCPAVLSPSLFNILQEYPEERAGRHLTLVAKTIQTLANFTWFHRKENYMEFLNDFIAQEQTNCRNFLIKVSTHNVQVGDNPEFMGDIDLGKHLALLHLQLVEALPSLTSNNNNLETNRVTTIVQNISAQLSHTPSSAIDGHYTPTTSNSHSFNNKKSDSMSMLPLHTGVRYTSQSHLVSTVTLSNTIQPPPPSHIQHNPDVAVGETSTNPSDRNNSHKISIRESNQYETVTPNSTIESRNSSKGYSISRIESTSEDLKIRSRSPNEMLTVPSVVDNDPSSISSNDYSEFYSSMDSWTMQMRNLCLDGGNHTNSQGSQTSISQLSNAASSGYQSITVSQPPSPIDSALRSEKFTSLENKPKNSLDARKVLVKTLQGVHPPDTLRVPRNSSQPGTKRQSRRISLHALPRHPTNSQTKGIVSSSHSLSTEDLSSLRKRRVRHIRAASSSSDADNDSSPERQHPRRHRVAKSSSASARSVSSSSATPEGQTHQLQQRKHYSRKERRYRSCDRDDYDLDDSKDDLYKNSFNKYEVDTTTRKLSNAQSYTQEGAMIENANDSQNILAAQEHQMKEIVERLMVMEAEFRAEQEAMRAELQQKEARIDAQARKIAELDCANTKMIRTIAYISNTSSDHGEAGLPRNETI
ncbi:unnamed protein product [Meganyctiphanes norvegica]|uniref:Ras GTPase-activating protein n=1 Tax=Meganyctiphanes norvegica TaxID=48144 RepID=A0AAV2Q6V4_MEGNR